MRNQYVFGIMLFLFLVYSVVVYTTGTNYEKGIDYYNNEAKMGKITFQKYNCIACHQVFGLGGYMGPDLTNMISRYKHSEQIARAYLSSGTSKMPDFHLSKDDIDGLIAYLKYLDQSSEYPLKNYSSSWTGAVHLDMKK